METVLEATNTHLYPGHEGKVTGFDIKAQSQLTCRIDFTDGGVVFGTLALGTNGDWELDVSPYVTTAGTDIAAKRWRITLKVDGDNTVRFRIRKQAAG